MDIRDDAQLQERLAAWVDEEIISSQQAEVIAAYERQRAPAPSSGPGATTSTEVTSPRRRSVTSPAEAIGYVGAALALGAIALILGDLWRELLVSGRLALVAALTLVVFGAGLAVRTAGSRAMERLTSVLFAATVAGIGWFAGVVGSDVLDLTGDATMLGVGVAMLVVAVPLYLWRPRALQQLVTLGSLVFTAIAALTMSPIEPGPEWFGLVVATIGAAWLLLAIGRWVTPTALGQILGALVTFLGIQIASFGDARLLALSTGIVVAGAFVALALRTDVLYHLVIGALALFVLSPQLVFELFGDAIGAPATLLLVGLLLVLLAVGLGRARREVVHDGGSDRVEDGPADGSPTDLEEAGEVR